MICFISALLWSRVYFSELVHRTGEGAADCAARWQIFSTQQTKKPIKGSKSQIKCQDCNYQPVFICWSTPPGRQHLSQHQGPHHGGRPTSGGDRGLSYPLSFLCFEPVLNHEISDWHNFISPFLHFDILLFWIYPIPHTLTIFGGGQAKAPPSFSPSFWIFDDISATQIWFCLEERHLEINKYMLLASILSNTILIYLQNP